jgi:hypothetical protein
VRCCIKSERLATCLPCFPSLVIYCIIVIRNNVLHESHVLVGQSVALFCCLCYSERFSVPRCALYIRHHWGEVFDISRGFFSWEYFYLYTSVSFRWSIHMYVYSAFL